MSTLYELALAIALTAASGTQVAAAHALAPVPAVLAQAGDYGFWGSMISALRGIGLAVSGVGLTVSILIKGAAGTNGDRHALAARVAEGVFAGLFVVLLGWIIYERMVEWTPL